MRVLSVCLSSSKKTFIITMSPVERVWQAISLRESLPAALGEGDEMAFLLLNFSFVMSVVLDRLEL